MNKDLFSKFLAGMAITTLGYFLGAVGGQLYQKAVGDEMEGHAAIQPILLHAATASLAQDQAGGDADHEKTSAEATGHSEAADHGDEVHAAGGPPEEDPNEKLDRDVGTFFSIYYCLTGLHAIHIIGGIIALSWIFWRSLLAQWRSDYFGPVDYVGLYWHLVDLIWIYLFPLLYLID